MSCLLHDRNVDTSGASCAVCEASGAIAEAKVLIEKWQASSGDFCPVDRILILHQKAIDALERGVREVAP